MRIASVTVPSIPSCGGIVSRDANIHLTIWASVLIHRVRFHPVTSYKTIKILKELGDDIDKYFDCVYSSHPLDWADGLEEVLENNGKTVVYDLGFE